MFECWIKQHWDRNFHPEFGDALTKEVNGMTFYLIASVGTTTAQVVPWSSLTIGQPVVTSSHNAVTHPVIDDSTYINNSTKWLHVNPTPGWVNLFGEWQIGDMSPPGTLTHLNEYPVDTPLGPKIIYPHNKAWPGLPNREYVGFWTVPNNTGICGGANTSGSNPCCDFFIPGSYTAHVNINYVKLLYINAPS